MNSAKLHTVLFYTVLMFALVILCTPTETESKRIIFYAPPRMELVTGQILASRAKEKPCPKCQMRDHRGHCRRIISFKSDGVNC